MQKIDVDTLNKILGINIHDEFNLHDFPEADRKKIEAKLIEKIENVILEIALGLLSEEQFQDFKTFVENEKDPAKMQAKIIELTKEITNFNTVLKQALHEEVKILKKAVSVV